MASWMRPITGPSAVPPNCFSRLLEGPRDVHAGIQVRRELPAELRELARADAAEEDPFQPARAFGGRPNLRVERVAQRVRLRLGLAWLAGCRRRGARRVRAEGRPAGFDLGREGRGPSRRVRLGPIAPRRTRSRVYWLSAHRGSPPETACGKAREGHSGRRKGPRVLDPIVAPRIAPVKSGRMTVVGSFDGPPPPIRVSARPRASTSGRETWRP